MFRRRFRRDNNYQQTLFNKYNIDETYLQTSKQRHACLNLLEKVDQKKKIDEKQLINKVANTFRGTELYKKIASCTTVAALLIVMQSAPVFAETVLNFQSQSEIVQIEKEAIAENRVIFDEDSLFGDQEQVRQPEIKNTSLHFVSNKPQFNDYSQMELNGVLIDEDSDISYFERQEITSLTVIDTTIEDWKTLAKSVNQGSILLLKKDDNPLDRMLETLKTLQHVESLNIISHGSSGKLHFSDKRISKESLQTNKAKWEELGTYLDKDGDINLFGCNVAQGESGKEFISELAKLTQADIGASLNHTGNESKGGDWELEVAVGDISTKEIFNSNKNLFKQLLAWSGTIDFSHVKTAGDASQSSSINAEAYESASKNFTLVLDGASGSTQIYAGYAYSNPPTNETKLTLYFKDATFSPNSIYIYSNNAACDATFNFSTNDGGSLSSTVVDLYGLTVDLTSLPDNVDKLYITETGNDCFDYSHNFMEFIVDNLTATDGTITAGDGVDESSTVNIPTTATASGSAVDIFDFKITDGGTADATALTATSIDIHVSGTDNSKLTYLLANASSGTNQGSDLSSSITGSYSSGTVTFDLSSNNIVVADGTSETYVVKAFFNDATSITDNTAITVSIDGDTDLTVDSGGTAVNGTQTAIDNSGNASMAVTATKLTFSTEPAGSTSGSTLTTQPVVTAQDASGNTDTDYTSTVTLSESSSGSLSGDIDITASSGVATFTDVVYTATVDGESFVLTASDSSITDATSGSVTSDVVATKLVFTTEPSPTALENGVQMDFTTDPVVEARDANDIKDTDFTETITLSENGSGSGSFTNNSVSAVAGVATFTGLTLNHDTDETFQLVADDQASVATDLSTVNSSDITVTSAPTITSATYNASTGVLVITGSGLTAGDGIDETTLTLTGEGGTTYTLVEQGTITATDSTTISITLDSTNKNEVNLLLNKAGTSSTGATTYNLAAASNWNTTSSDESAEAIQAITVSSVQTPTITSATYNANTGVLAITGTNFVSNSGSTNDITVTNLSLSGQGSGSYTLTTSSVEVTDTTSASITLNAIDKLNVNGLLNKDGVASVDSVTYNLAGAEDWMAGYSGTDVDTTGNAVTVSSVQTPTITSATYDASSGVLAVTGTNLVASVGSTNDVDVSKLTLTGEGSGTRVLTTSDVEITDATSFSITLNSADKSAVNLLLNKDGTASSGSTTYNLAAADDWNSVITDADISDATSNAITVSNVQAPTITGATYDATTGALVVTGANFVSNSGSTNDIDVTKLSLTGEGSSSYTLTTSNVEVTSDTEFTITLNSTDKLNINGLLNKDGTSSDDSTTYNLAGAEDWMAGYSSTDADTTGNAVTVSNVSVPTITSATYDYSTGALVVTGTNFVSNSGSLNDVDVSKLTLTGESGVTYTLTSTDVEITDATTFTVTLNTIDKLNVNGLLNKAGTSSDSGTTYNLAASDDWMSAGASSTDISDATANAITVSNIQAPTITSATYNANTGVLAITGTNFVKSSGASNDITVTNLSLSGQGSGSYTLTTSSVEVTDTTSASITLNAIDKLNVNGLLNKDGVASVDSVTYNLAGAEDWMAGYSSTDVDTTGNAVTVSSVQTPTITSATYDVNSGVLAVTGTNLVASVGSTNDVDVSKLTLTGEGSGTRVLTTSDVEITDATSFNITLNSADKSAVNLLLNKDGTASSGSTTYNLAAADDWNSVITDADISDATSNAITVSNVQAPTITGATYDATTGALVVTGANFVSNSGSTNDIDVTKLSLTGEGSSSYTLTTSNVEVTSDTEFTITLNSTDKLNINGLLNKDGTSSDDSTTYNLAGAEDWMAGYSSTDADTTGNAVTVSNVSVPTITSATYDYSTGVLVVTGTDFVSNSGSLNDVDVSKLTLTGESGVTYTLTSTDVEVTSDTEFSVTLNSTDKSNLNGLLNKDGTSSDDSTTYNLAAADDWMAAGASSTDIADLTSNAITVSNVDEIAPTVSSVSSTTTDSNYKADDVIAITVEFSEIVNVTGIPQLTLETGTTDRTVDYTSGSGTSILTFNYTVQSGDTSADLDYLSTTALALNSGTIKDVAGNVATLTLATPGAVNSLGANKALVVDTTAPTVSSVSVPSGDTYVESGTLSFTVNTNEVITVDTSSGTPRLTLTIGSTTKYATYASGTGTTALVFTYSVESDLEDTDGIALGSTIDLNSGTLKDATGNDLSTTLNSVASLTSVLVDSILPTVSSVSVPSDATYVEGGTLSFTVNTNEVITVDTSSGTPRLTLTIGSTTKYATYASGTDTTALVFTYSVESDLEDTDGIALGSTIDLNSGTLKDAAGNDLSTTLNSVASLTSVLVDSILPVVSSVSVPSDKTYVEDEILTFTVNTDDNVTVDTTNGTPRLTLTIGSVTKYATFSSGSGTTALVFTYTVEDSLEDTDGIEVSGTIDLNSGTMKDSSGNDLVTTLNSIGSLTSVLVDSTDSILTDGNISITSNPSGTSNTYVAGDTITVQWNNSSTGDDNADTISTVTADFSAFGGGSSVSASSSGDIWTASYTVVSGSIDSSNLNVSVTATDDAGNTTTTADTSNLSLDNVAPILTDGNISITSSPSGTSSTYVAGDTITVSWNNTNDGNSDISAVTADFSAFGGGSSVSATETSGTWTASYTIVSGSIDASNLNVSLTATDDAGNTTTTSDTSNLKLENIVPVVSSVSVPSDKTYVEDEILTFTVTTDDNVTVDTTNGTPRLTLTIGSVTKYATFSSGSGTTALVFTYTVEDSLEDTDGIEVSGTIDLNSGTMKDSSGNDLVTTLNSIGSLTSVLVDSTDSILTDGNISITSNPSGTSNTYVAGDAITVQWNNSSTGDDNADTISTVTADFSAFGGGSSVSASSSGDIWTASYTVVSGSIDSSNLNVSVTATDDAGNTTTTADTSNLSLDNVAPILTDGNISITSSPSGTSSTYVAGDTITVSWNNTNDGNSDISAVTADFSAFGGGSSVSATETSGTWTASYTIVSGSIDASNLNVSLTATDDAGNTTTTSDTSNLKLENIVPVVSSVSVPSDKTYVEDEILTFTVNTDDNVTVDTTNGTPRLTLTIGSVTKYATFSSGSGTTALVFTYTVEDSLEDTDGIEVSGTIDLNSGTMKDSSGNDLTTTLNSIGSLTSVRVDSVVPANYSISIDDKYLNSSDTDLSFTFSEAEIGATYNYSVDDNDSGTTAITGSGIIITETDIVSDVDVSSLSDDTLTLTVSLTDVNNNTGNDVTDTVVKDTIIETNVTLSPENSSINEELNTNLTITFNENMYIGTGNIYVYDSSDNSIYETIDATGKYVTIDDTQKVITINPHKELSTGTTYYILTDDTVFKDSYDNYYSIEANTTWSFTTITIPDVAFKMTGSYGDDDLEPGDVITYTMTISTTDSDLSNTELFAYIPSDTTYVAGSTTINGSAITDNNNELPLKEGYSLGTISIGSEINVSYQTTLDSHAIRGMLITNQSEITGEDANGDKIHTVLSTDSNSSDDETPTELVVGDMTFLTAEYEMEDEDGGDIEAGDILTLKMTLKNNGTRLAKHVTIENNIPDGTTLISGISVNASISALKLTKNVVSKTQNISKNVNMISANIQYSQSSTNEINYDVGDLSSNSSVTISYQVQVDDTFDKTIEKSISSTADINADNATKVTANVATAVTELPLLLLETSLLDENGDNAEEGDVLHYEISMENSGKAMATNIDITNTLPTGVTYVSDSITVNGIEYSDDSSVPQTFSGYDLDVDETLVIKFNVKINTGLSKNENLEFTTSYSADDDLSDSSSESLQIDAVTGKLIIEGTAESQIGNTPEGWIVELSSDGTVLTQETLDSNGEFIFSGVSAENNYTVQVKHPETSVSFSKESVVNKSAGTIVDLSMPMDASGIIYNSVTRTAVKGAKVYITGPDNKLVSEDYLADDQQGQTTGEDGYYNFDIDFTQATSGKYTISVVAPSGYSSASSSEIIKATIDTEDDGYDPSSEASPFKVVASSSIPEAGDKTIYYMAFELEEDDPAIVNNHIAVDPSESNIIVVTKSANKKYASIGEFVTYTLEVTNIGSETISDFTLYDKTPSGFKYVKGTATLKDEDGDIDKKENPNGTRLIDWDDITLEAGESLTVKYSLLVGTGVITNKEYINSAYVKLSKISLSNIAKAAVLIINDADLNGVMIIGKVFDDKNENGVQDNGEAGIQGVKIFSTTGEIITTDKYGRYHLIIANDKVSRFGYTLVLKLDENSLPKETKFLTKNPRILKIKNGLMEKGNFRVKIGE